MIRQVRRIVTGRDGEGRSRVLAAGPAPNGVDHPAWPGLGATMLWAVASVPADNRGDRDATDGAFAAMPGAGGVNFVVAQFPPEAEFEAMTPEQRIAARDTGEFLAEDAVAPEDAASGMHSTPTVDFDVVLSGRLTLVLDDGEHELAPGDTVVLRGDRHAWRNYGSEPATMAVITVSAKPL